jgi:hypothetical protein
VIDDCDYYILIIAGKYGSVAGSGKSYTQLEYEYAVSKGIKVIAFIHADPKKLPKDKYETDDDIRQKLEEFKSEVSKGRLVKMWEHENELPGLVAVSLSKAIKMYPSAGWVRGDTVANEDMLSEINTLRKENQLLNIENQTLKAMNAVQASDDLASGETKTSIRGSYTAYTPSYKPNAAWDVVVSWDDIIRDLSVILLEHPNDTRVRAHLTSRLFERSDKVKWGKDASLNGKDYDKIKLQLMALGIADIRYSRTVAGTMDLFWAYTKKGLDYLVTIGSEKKP